MAVNGITITDLTPIGNALAGNYVMPIVNMSIDETQKVTVQNLGNFILGPLANSLTLTISNINVSNNAIINNATVNLTLTGNTANFSGNVSTGNINANGNIRISNTNPTNGLFTDHLYYANGNSWNFTNSVGTLGQVQYSNGDGNFAASNVFVWDTSSNTLNVQNLNLVYANTDTNQGTVQQVLGIVNQANQTLGWKTLPTNYFTVETTRSDPGNSYISSIVPVLRIIPIKARNYVSNTFTGYVPIPAA